MIHLKEFNMFQNAYDFYILCHKLNNNIEIEYPNISCDSINTIIINLSFACEIFIKTSLFVDKQKIAKSHHLNNLFEKLNKNDKKIIKSIVSLDYLLTYSQSNNKNLIQKRLKEVSHYFVDLRYWYEYDIKSNKRNIDYTGCCFLKKLCDALILLLLNKLNIENDETHQPIITNQDKYIKLMEQANA